MGKTKKAAIMAMKVDLGCHKCYKKVKIVLSKFLEIRDQIYDEKENRVVIKVLCSNPEELRDKICYKGGGAIKSIEILKPEKPKPPEPAEKPKEPEKPKPAEKPKEPEKPKPTEKPKEPEKNPTSSALLFNLLFLALALSLSLFLILPHTISP